MYSEKIFSYGTLQYEQVQMSNFGRLLNGTIDSLSQFTLSQLTINDPDVIETSGDSVHPIISYTGDFEHQVQGMVFEISQEELAQADSYEVADYKRIQVKLDSGTLAWVYVHAETNAPSKE